ncbi:MAG: glycosyl hydrolase [Gemmatimonadetes bacterium]|nr:glycosyl hydrolase [Gemmatimonadota bacterium]
MRVLTVIGVAAVWGAVTGGEARAQAPSGGGFDPALFGVWQWRSIGPIVGGRSLAVAGSARRPLEYYFGATGGGVWKTTDGGTTWAPVSDGQFRTASVGSIGICEANPDVVYVGMGEGQFRSQFSAGDGVYGTRDGGKTWTHLGLESSTGQQVVPRLRVHPQDCDVVYAAVLGDPHGPNPERGVYRSRDGGRTWQKVLDRGAGATDLVLDPSSPQVLYATLWDIVFPPWGGVTGSRSGVYKSTDGGDTWTEITRNPGLPRGKLGKMAVAVSADPRRAYLDIEAHPDSGGVFRSDDGGATWQLMNSHNGLFHRAEYYVRIYADPKDADRVYVLNRDFYASSDGGKTFTQIRAPHGDHHDLWIAPDDPQRMINGNDGGANVSFNGGLTWTDQDYPTAQMYNVITTNEFPYFVCGAQQDNSSKCVPSDGVGDFFYQGAGGEQGYIAVHPRVPTLGYGGSQRGGLTRHDRLTGQRQTVDVWPMLTDGDPPLKLRERFQWTFPIVMSPHDPEVVYAGSQHLWRTTNRGLSWERISSDLTRADPKTLVGAQEVINDHSGSDYYATIFTIAPSPHDPNEIWTGSDDGVIHVTRDGGGNWTNVTPPELPPYAKASLMFASPHRPGKVYLAAEKYKLQDIAPYIFKTEDYGKTWTKIVNGIPNGHWVRAVIEDPVRPGLLFAGTERGPYASFDDGSHWQPLSLNLPAVQVSDLEVRDNDLVISTFGRGFYVLDNISPLRELGPEVLARRLHVFKPMDAIRTAGTVTAGDGGRLYRRSRIPGANRVEIYYSLREPASRVTIEVLDVRGRTIRTFTGAADERPRVVMRNSVGDVINGPSWGLATPPPPVRTAAGLHRFPWDLRTLPARDFPGLRLREENVDGPVVPPGEYRVRVTADGQSQEHTFRIHKDPRLTEVTQADLEAQFDLAMRAQLRTNSATSTVVRIRAIKGQVGDRIQRAGGERRIAEAGEALKARLTDVEGAIYQFRIEAESDIKHYGPDITNKLSQVNAAVRSADARPPRQVYEIFEELSAALDAQLRQLDQVLANELPRFNQLLQGRNLPPVEQNAPVASEGAGGPGRG